MICLAYFHIRIPVISTRLEFHVKVKDFPTWSSSWHELTALTNRQLFGLKVNMSCALYIAIIIYNGAFFANMITPLVWLFPVITVAHNLHEQFFCVNADDYVLIALKMNPLKILYFNRSNSIWQSEQRFTWSMSQIWHIQ